MDGPPTRYALACEACRERIPDPVGMTTTNPAGILLDHALIECPACGHAKPRGREPTWIVVIPPHKRRPV